MNDKPKALDLDLHWKGDLLFEARSNGISFDLDGATKAAPSPVQALAGALAGCMAIDVVLILTRGRFPPRSLNARLKGHRAADDPKRFTAFDLRYVVEGDVPAEKVERAIALSREKYCSVWHSLRQDIAFETSFEIRP